MKVTKLKIKMNNKRDNNKKENQKLIKLQDEQSKKENANWKISILFKKI